MTLTTTPARTRLDALLDHRLDLLLSGALALQLSLLAVAPLCVVPQFRSIFQAMNVEVPLATSLLVGWSSLLEAAWFVILPLLALGIATLCVRVPLAWVRRAEAAPRPQARKLAQLGLSLYLVGANLACLVAGFSGWMALCMPMLRLVNNVG